MRKLSTLSLQLKKPQDIIPNHTHETKNKQKNLERDNTLRNVNAKDTTRHNITLITSTSREYIPYYPFAPQLSYIK